MLFVFDLIICCWFTLFIIALRTGAKISESAKCHCGKIVDELGLHGLSCTKNAGCFLRRSAISSILKTSLTCINLPSTLEPVGWTRDRRRPSGLTFRPLVQRPNMDATVVDTFAWGHYKDSARQAGFAATKAEAAKCQKYLDLQSNYHFQPVAIRPLVCIASPLPLFRVASQRNLLIGLVTPVYLLNPITFSYYYLPITFWILVLSVSLFVPSVVQCYFAHWLTILSIP